MAPVSRFHTQHKSLCAFRADRDRGYLNQTNYDVLPGIQDTGQADSSNLFADKTLVPPR
jgi:hypothetical protein